MYCFTSKKILNFQNWILTNIFFIDIDIEKNDSNINNSNFNYLITKQPYKDTMSRYFLIFFT